MPLYDAAAAKCDTPEITGALLAAQGKAESGFRADAKGPVVTADGKTGQAQGIAQFMSWSWKPEWGDPFNPANGINAQGEKMCALTTNKWVKGAQKDSQGSILLLSLAAYNAGEGNVNKAHGVPNFPETIKYIHNILDFAGTYDGMDPVLAMNIKALLEDPDVHYNLFVFYGCRSYEEQTRLYQNKLKEKNGNVYEARKDVADPDNGDGSHHMVNKKTGVCSAADINGKLPLLVSKVDQYGMYLPMDGTNGKSKEDWHVENKK